MSSWILHWYLASLKINNSPEIANYSTVNVGTDDLNADETQLDLENK